MAFSYARESLFFILFIAATISSALIGWFLARKALLDVEEVTRTAREISKGAFAKRVSINGRFDEIKRLGGTFNMMLDQIQTVLKSMREINDNIAHDLRSPLARIRGTAEMSLMGGQSLDELKNMAADTVEECDNLIGMINTMLDITEVEAGLKEPEEENLNVVELISDICELFRPVADTKFISMQIELPEEIHLTTDRKKLQRIVSNLLENAIKYTPEGGHLSVSVKSDGKEVEISFEDTGSGISETDMLYIFDRFYRCDRSRSQSGSGLGLSLAKAFTEAMNGSIRVVSNIGKGSRFIVSFSL